MNQPLAEERANWMRRIRICWNCRIDYDAWERYVEYAGEECAMVLEPANYPLHQWSEIEKKMLFCSDTCQVEHALKRGTD